MDKYILVPQDRYETMVKKEKDSITNSSSSAKTINPPPPGLPATDHRAQQGLLVSGEEAEVISRALVDASLDNHRESKTGKHTQNQNTDWSELWETRQ